jgi:hypothetical protein
MFKSFFALAALTTLCMASPGFAQSFGQASNSSSSTNSEWKPQNPEQQESTLRQLVQESRGSKKN